MSIISLADKAIIDNYAAGHCDQTFNQPEM